MAEAIGRRERAPLRRGERLAATFGAVALLTIALWLLSNPPDRTVALGGCENAAAGCLVNVDAETATFAAAIAALAGAFGLIALLGIRLTSLRAGGVELAFDARTAGLAEAVPQPSPQPGSIGDGTAGTTPVDASEGSTTSPLHVKVVNGLGTEVGLVPVAVASLGTPMERSHAQFLRDYQSARRLSQRGWFLVHLLGPAKSTGQMYSVAIKVTPHRDATGELRAARFYLGRSWGHQVFEGRRGADGRFGITTEAYGPFLALCEIEFTSGERILLDHYCDFEMGALVTA